MTDPFGRTATFTYNAAGQLASITDVIGLVSQLDYGPEDFVTAVTTPYGRTSFRHEPTDNWVNRFIEATDRLGGTERLEYRWTTTDLAPSVPAAEVPTGFTEANTELHSYNTFYWDTLAWSRAPGDPTAATISKWLVAGAWPGATAYATGVPHSVKTPLEARIWYLYPGQTNSASSGSHSQPNRTGRVLDDGASQIHQATYNAQGSVLTNTDPLGRQVSSTYATNGRDQLQTLQTTAGLNDLLGTYGNYTALGQPQTITDAAGRTTTVTYSATGQVLTVTNAAGHTTTTTYDASHRVSTVTGPEAGATTSYSYDGFGRIRTVTDADGATLTTDYDAFDRPVRTTYPDASYEETTYDRLDVATRRDRAGRLTRSYYDAMRRLLGTRDPLGRTVGQQWCACGSLEALVDGAGNRTSWERDLQGRVTREVRADGVTDILYAYGARSGRLLTVTDPKDQVTTYTYALDDQVLATSYTNAVIATPGVSFTYDAPYARVATMVDGTGTTTYGYHPVGQLGAGQVASVDGPLTNDTLTYSYDPLGRVATRAIAGAVVDWTFDALGRVTSEANVLGTFTYTYDGPSARVATVTYPNNQTSTYAYFGNTHDRRLQTIHHKYPNGATLSKFDYTYDLAGNILTWRQQADSTAVQWAYGYDAADQLLSAIKQASDAPQTVLTRYGYGYDPAANRVVEQIDDQVTGASYDNLNRLLTQQPAGALQFAGTVSEPATVTVKGVPAVVGVDQAFTAAVPLAPGTNPVTVTATDPSGNIATRLYEVDSVGSGRTFAYDANGNLTTDGTRTFEWDARNQLVAVTVGTHRSEFAYDGLKRRVRIVEKENGVSQSDTRVLWCDTAICEERAADGTMVTRRALALGEQVAGSTQFFLRDHLGGVIDVTDGAAMPLARYAFDPSGRRTLNGGNDVTTVGFTGHREQSAAGLWLTWHRAYDPSLGRFLSQDPIAFEAGPNFYAYALNNPVNWTDPFGLDVTVCFYPDAAMTFGHVGFGLPGESGTSGYYPDGIQEDKQQNKQCKTIKSPPDKDKCMLKCRERRQANPGQYNLFTRQCTSFVRECLKECGLPAGDYDGPRPRRFFRTVSGQ